MDLRLFSLADNISAMSRKDILRAGIAPYEKMKERTRAIARGELKPDPSDPKLWFTSAKIADAYAEVPVEEGLAEIDSLVVRE